MHQGARTREETRGRFAIVNIILAELLYQMLLLIVNLRPIPKQKKDSIDSKYPPLKEYDDEPKSHKETRQVHWVPHKGVRAGRNKNITVEVLF